MSQEYIAYSDTSRPMLYNGTILQLPLEAFKTMYSNQPGQITKESGMGSILYDLASASGGPKVWFEIGAWNGLGTTTCILDGFLHRDEDVCLYSLEADPIFFEIARENLKHHPMFSTLSLHYAKSGEGAFPLVEANDDHYYMFYDYERHFWNLAPPFSFPSHPELAVLDGGEYTGELDWAHLPKDNLKWVFLDDICCMKNKKVYEGLLADRKWSMVKVDLDDRNGYAIFRRA